MGYARNSPVAIRCAALLVVLSVITAACAAAAPDPLEGVEDSLIEQTGLLWVNAFGLVQLDVDVWRSRLGEACERGVWEREIALELAERYVAEDESVSARPAEIGPPTPAEAASTLWTMAVQVCGDSFPGGTGGPPFGGSG